MAFPNPPENERRKEPRRKPKSNLSVWCRKGSTGLGSNLAKAVLDISTSGLRLRLTERLEPHQEIEVELLTAEMNYRFTVTAEVVWCLAEADGTFVVGAELRKSFTLAELRELT